MDGSAALLAAADGVLSGLRILADPPAAAKVLPGGQDLGMKAWVRKAEADWPNNCP